MDTQEKIQKSIIELLTLACLSEDVSAGYQISHLIHERTEGAIQIPASRMLRYLYRLLEQGSIREAPQVIDDRMSTRYVLTPEGEDRMAMLIDAYVNTHQAFLVFLDKRWKALRGDRPKKESV